MDFIMKAMFDKDHDMGQRIAIISALGGSGKTQLAIKFARDQSETYAFVRFVISQVLTQLQV